MAVSGDVSIPAPHGRLEGIHRFPPEAPGSPATSPPTASPRGLAPHGSSCALVLHPHPLFGGTMHNKVVFQAAKALLEAGYATLRINFRGVGRSTGVHDGGRGEVEDARVALDWLLERHAPVGRVLVAGFSFGAAVAIQLAGSDPRIQRLIAIGTPVRALDAGALDASRVPTLFVHGASDDVAPLEPLRALLDGHPSPARRLVVLPGTGHFFDERLDELRDAVLDFAR